MPEPANWVIPAPALTTIGDVSDLRLSVAGEELYYRWPSTALPPRVGDVVLAALLLPAMKAGVGLDLSAEIPISPLLSEGIVRLQEIFHAWYPELRPIAVRAAIASRREDGVGVGAFFSGGVDSCHTLVKHRGEITHLVFVRGVDLQLDNEAGWQESSRAVQTIAAEYGKTLLSVETNVRFFARRLAGISWLPYQGAGLASVGLLTGLRRLYLSSSNHYSAIHPLGTHPLTDPLWSTSYTEFVHEGAALHRYEKLRALRDHPVLLDNLRVCWQDSGYNCGHCDKCLHLRVALHLLGMSTPRMPPLADLGELKTIMVHTVGEYAEWEDNLLLAREVGDKRLERAVRRPLDRFLLRRAVRSLDWILTRGMLGRLLGRRS